VLASGCAREGPILYSARRREHPVNLRLAPPLAGRPRGSTGKRQQNPARTLYKTKRNANSAEERYKLASPGRNARLSTNKSTSAMALFDFLGKKKGDAAPRKVSGRELGRLEKLVSNKMSQNYDRQEAIEELSRMASAESSAVLLKRFTWHMDPSITDQEEKESAVRGIVAAGEAAIEPIREFCRRAESLTWSLKVLREIVPKERYGEELLSVLDEFDTEYVRNPEPKVQLIAALEEYPSEEVRVAVEPFVQDMSEPVRFTAVTTLFAINDPASVPTLIAALEQEESLRVKNRIAQGLAERGWQIPAEVVGACKTALPADFTLQGNVVRRGA
jgi:hypothetical protein